MNAYKIGMSVPCFVLACAVAQAAPVPVSNVLTTPGFSSSGTTSNGQTLAYIQLGGVWYAPSGALCTSCAGGDLSRAVNEPDPVSRTNALSGLKFTQAVVNIGSNAKFSLGLTVEDDSVGILLGELGTNQQNTGDPINVYPTLNGTRVGSWVRTIVAADYGDTGSLWQNTYGSLIMHSFLTVFRHSDFTNDTGVLTFDGIELAGNTGYDPNLVATIGEPAPSAEPVASRVLPATATFLPGFVVNPETNLQTVVSITTSEGTFTNLTGFTCASVSGGAVYQTNTNEPMTLVEAMSGLKFTELVANATSMDFSIGRTVNSTDDRVRFFLSECEVDTAGTMDTMIIYPLSGSTRIFTWALELTSPDYGTPSPKWNAIRVSDKHNPGFYGHLATFALSDFTNGPPVALTGVTGFRVVIPNIGGAQADPSVFGMYEVPPPPPKGTMIRVW